MLLHHLDHRLCEGRGWSLRAAFVLTASRGRCPVEFMSESLLEIVNPVDQRIEQKDVL